MASRTILITTPYFYPTVGGLENYAFATARGLVARGFKVVVACGDHVNRIQTQSIDGITIYRLPIWFTVSNTPVNLLWPGMLRRIIKKERPDIINAHTPVPFMVDMTALAAGHTPLVVTYHAATLFKQSSLLVRLVTSMYLPVQALTLRKARSIFAVSAYVKQSLAPGLRDKTFVMPNATYAQSRPRRGTQDGLVFVANLEPTHAWKGLDVLIGSLAVLRASGKAVPNLTVIGDGAYRSHYESQVAELGLTAQVTFAGRIVGRNRDRVMSRAQALVMCPTTANDAFPTVLLEAWSLGLPAIASAIGPIPSLIEQGITGLLVPPGDKYELARTISAALAKPEKLQAMGAIGHRLVRVEYNWDVQVSRASRLLEQLV